MGLLFDLIAGIGNPVPKTPTLGLVENAAKAPAAPQAHLPKPTQIPAPKIAPEAASEPKRNAWTITRGGKPICTVCGTPMTRDEALTEALWRWVDADILEN